MISIKRRVLSSITDQEIKRLKQLTLRPGYSGLRTDLNNALRDSEIGKGFIFFIAKIDGKIVGWGALTNFAQSGECCDFGVYVEAKYRKQGIASRLLFASENYVEKKFGKDFYIDVYPHDKKSECFFNKYDYCDCDEYVK